MKEERSQTNIYYNYYAKSVRGGFVNVIYFSLKDKNGRLSNIAQRRGNASVKPIIYLNGYFYFYGRHSDIIWKERLNLKTNIKLPKMMFLVKT
jgi:hypothetical protein